MLTAFKHLKAYSLKEIRLGFVLVIVFWFWPQGLKWTFDSISVSSGHCCGLSGLQKHDIGRYECKGIYKEDSSWKNLPFEWTFQDSFYFPLKLFNLFLNIKSTSCLITENLQKPRSLKKQKEKNHCPVNWR